MTELSSSNGLLHTRYDAALPSYFARCVTIPVVATVSHG